MALPVTIDPTLPPDSETPQAGALRIRNLTQALVDLFGLPIAPTTITGALFSTTAAGQVSYTNGAPGALFTNKTGLTLAAGAVVALDSTFNRAVALSDFAGSLVQFVVSLAPLAPDADGGFGTQGYTPVVGVTGAVTRGNYLRKSATTLVAEDTGIAMASATAAPAGAIAIALSSAAGPGLGTVQAYLLGVVPSLNSITAGAGGAIGRVGGVIDAQSGAVGTPASLIETQLFGYSMPANTLNVNNQGVRVTAWGTLANDTSMKVIRLYFGAMVDAFNVAHSGYWRVSMTALRVGAATTTITFQRQATDLSGTVFENEVITRNATDVLANIVGLQVTGQNVVAVANEIIASGWLVEWL